MTRKEFEYLRLSIQKEKLKINEPCGPFGYAIARARLKRAQLQRLVDAGRNIDSKTVQAKVARWQRKIEQLDKVPTRMNALIATSTSADDVRFRVAASKNY